MLKLVYPNLPVQAFLQDVDPDARNEYIALMSECGGDDGYYYYPDATAEVFRLLVAEIEANPLGRRTGPSVTRDGSTSMSFRFEEIYLHVDVAPERMYFSMKFSGTLLAAIKSNVVHHPQVPSDGFVGRVSAWRKEVAKKRLASRGFPAAGAEVLCERRCRRETERQEPRLSLEISESRETVKKVVTVGFVAAAIGFGYWGSLYDDAGPRNILLVFAAISVLVGVVTALKK